MLNKLLLFFIAALTPLLPLSAKIIETNEISTIQNYVTKDSLILFNITGTLYNPGTTLADNQWRIYFTNRVNSIVPDQVAAEYLINKVKNEIVSNIPKKAVEKATPQLIADLQSQKIPVLGITRKKMATPFAENFGLITSKHLLSLGIDLEKTLTYFPVKNQENQNYSFAYGILFSNDKPVGPVIFEFLKQLPEKPAKIIMIDNSNTALESAADALKDTGINFDGFRFNRSDINSANFDPVIGTIQFFAFINSKQIMSDEEALQVKQNNPNVDYDLLLNEYIRKSIKQVKNQ